MSYKGSGRYCSVVGCNSSTKKLSIFANSICNYHNLLNKDCPCLVPFSLHSFPKGSVLRQQWIAVLNRKDFVPKKHSVVCSLHFLDGMRTEKNPVPQLHLGYRKEVKVGRTPPRSRKVVNSVKKTNVVHHEPMNTESQSTSFDTTGISCEDTNNITASVQVQTEIHQYCDSSTQWEDPSLGDHTYCSPSLLSKSQSCQTDFQPFSYEDLTETDCKFFTGLSLTIFLSLVKILSECNKFPFRLSSGDQILLVLMRLRLGLLYADLARRFEISTSLACKIFTSWLPFLAKELKFLICWLSRETLQLTMPHSFKENYPQTTCIIDCTEIFIYRPTLLTSRAQTYSQYKHHNTVKAMICIAPCGYFMFVSKCFGGRASDKFIVTSSGMLDYLLPGDEVMADRGFTIELEVATKQAKLNIPAFTKGQVQLSANDVTKTRRIAAVRIHVERAIGKLKNYRILKNVMPSQSVKKQIDNIIVVCCALCNLQYPILKRRVS